MNLRLWVSSLEDDFRAAPFLLLFVLSALADDFADLIRGNETLDAADRDSDRDDFLEDFFDSFDFFDDSFFKEEEEKIREIFKCLYKLF